MAAAGLKRFSVFEAADDHMEVDWDMFDESCQQPQSSQYHVTEDTCYNSPFYVGKTKREKGFNSCHKNLFRDNNQDNSMEDKCNNSCATKRTKFDNCFNMDEDSGLGMEETESTDSYDTVPPTINLDRPFAGFSSSISGSRSPGSLHDDVSAHPAGVTCSVMRITRAVDKLSSDPDLVADGSRVASLRIVPSKRKEMLEISAEILANVIRGQFDQTLHHVTIIDCRYPYEYDGGHITGALNLYTKKQLMQFLQQTPTTDRIPIVIFHCEFSSQRGPNMYRFMRTCDRELHEDVYPHLTFPEMYLLQGGYKAFFQQHKDLCEPQLYTPMSHIQHGKELRHFRIKSKSWPPHSKSRSSLQDSWNVTRLTFNELS